MAKTDFFLLDALNPPFREGDDIKYAILMKRFNLEMVHPVSFYSTYFNGLKKLGIKGLRLHATDKLRSYPTYDNAGRNIKYSPQGYVEKPTPGIFPLCRVVWVYNHKANYFNKSPIDKNKEIVNILKTLTAEACNEMDWDVKLFDKIFEDIEALNGRLVYQLTKRRATKNKKHAAGLNVKIYPATTECYLEVVDQETHASKEILVSIENNYRGSSGTWNLDGLRYIQQGTWIDDLHYLAHDNSNKVNYIVNVETGNVELKFNVEEDRYKKDFIKEYESATTLDEQFIDDLLKPVI